MCYTKILKVETGIRMAQAKAITLEAEDLKYLQSTIRQRTIQAQVADRAKMLLYKSQGASNGEIADRLGVNINTVKLCLSKFKEGGVKRALFDDRRNGRPVEITDDAVAWIVSVACQRPYDLGYSQELWTLRNLHRHIQNHAIEAGYLRLATITVPMVQKILKRSEIKPFKIKYYCEKRDSDFEAKMHDILLVYKQIEMQIDENGNLVLPPEGPVVHTVSCDEKPGIQAIATTCDDLRPAAGKGCICRDCEYKRLGTLSLIAGIDLLTGIAIPVVSETHRSSDFIALLEKLDNMYPQGDVIRIVCDNHSAHSSKEVQNYLSTKRNGRFTFVFTPKHASWLNLIECFLSKMTKQMLRGIRVKTKEELARRIYQYFDEVNAEPVVFRWSYKLDEVSLKSTVS